MTELEILRQAVIDLTDPAIVNNQQREIAYRLLIQGIEVHKGYQRGSMHWPTSDCGLPRDMVAAYQARRRGQFLQQFEEETGKGGESHPGDEPLGFEDNSHSGERYFSGIIKHKPQKY